MKIRLQLLSFGLLFYLVCCQVALRADQVDMANGDRYFGKVVTVTADTVTMNSEILGKVKLPRKLVSGLIFGTNVLAVSVASPPNNTTALVISQTNKLVANADLTATLKTLGAGNTNFVSQIRDQMLAGSPDATSKYNEMVAGLMNGSISLSDLRNQARASAAQLRELKQQLGPDADESLDGYLEVLDSFIKETDNQAGNSPGH